MNRFGFQWPENLNCNKFPTDGLCVGENRTEEALLPDPKPTHEGDKLLHK